MKLAEDSPRCDLRHESQRPMAIETLLKLQFPMAMRAVARLRRRLFRNHLNGQRRARNSFADIWMEYGPKAV
jgi:hypothetical protein